MTEALRSSGFNGMLPECKPEFETGKLDPRSWGCRDCSEELCVVYESLHPKLSAVTPQPIDVVPEVKLPNQNLDLLEVQALWELVYTTAYLVIRQI